MLHKCCTSGGIQAITLHYIWSFYLKCLLAVTISWVLLLVLFCLFVFFPLDSHIQPDSEAWESTHSCLGSILAPLLTIYMTLVHSDPLLTIP